MAIPALVWTLPVEPSPATTADSHKLNNDLVVVSDKFGTTGWLVAAWFFCCINRT